jgi:branched-subunit amino acid aminotransferase/4-amino-4-deoxychorismate lyase
MSGVMDQRVIGGILVDGDLCDAGDASLSVLDIGLQRGYGCFEALRSYGGKSFRVEAHCARLAASAAKLGIPLPDDGVIEGWIADRSAAGGDCVVRVLVTGGLDPYRPGDGSRVIVLAEPLPASSEPMLVEPLTAPWHPDGAASELTGAKTLSYGPNLAASLAAQRSGYDDALLIGRSGSVLEGPTYGVAWIVGGVVETPSLDLGILASITRTATLEVAAAAGVVVAEGRYPLERMLAAEEAFAMSTVKEILPIASVGDRTWDAGPVTQRLASGFSDLVSAEIAAA